MKKKLLKSTMLAFAAAGLMAGGTMAADWSYSASEAAQYSIIASSWQDGLDFTIPQAAASNYAGFDIFMNNSLEIGNIISLGAGNMTAASLGSDGDFKVIASVPEPATMLLFGTGMASLAGFVRRKKVWKNS